MTKPTSERQTRSDKFPLTLHKTGRFCKKIKGKMYYFGTDRRQALDRYLEQAACLHAGRPVSRGSTADQLSIKTMCNLDIEHSRVTFPRGKTGIGRNLPLRSPRSSQNS
jgi:hypothetical protein